MATVKRFEELQVWQMARHQCEQFYALVQNGAFKNHFLLQDQIDRSSGSVMNNIAEGFDRFSKADFRHFLVISRGSNAEFRSQLYRAFHRNIINDALFNELKIAAEHLGVKLHHFISYLNQSGFNTKPGAKDNTGNNPHLEEPIVEYNSSPTYQVPDQFYFSH